MWGVQKWWDLSKHVSNTLTSLILFTFAALRVISLCLDDDNGGEFCLGGMSKKKLKWLDSIFWPAIAFSRNLNTINLKIFPNHGGIYRSDRKFNTCLERWNTVRFIEIWDNIALRLILGRVVINSMFLYHFVDPDRRVKIFKNERPTEKGNINFELENWGTCTDSFWGWRKFHGEPVCFLIFWVWWQKKLLKAPLTCTFIHRLMIFLSAWLQFRIKEKIK